MEITATLKRGHDRITHLLFADMLIFCKGGHSSVEALNTLLDDMYFNTGFTNEQEQKQGICQ